MTVACFVSDAVTRILRAKHLSLFLFLLLLVLGVPQLSVAQCGGDHQRACCVLDQGPTGCQSGMTEVVGCPAQDSQFSGNCECTVNIAGSWVFSGSYTGNSCEANISECGHAGERACCVGEGGAPVGGCFSGTYPVDGCTGDNCYCASGAKSSSSCVTITSCGHPGERACCLGENPDLPATGACDFNNDVQQVPGCDDATGNCYCGPAPGLSTITGAKAIGTCVQAAHCGGVGERACCTANGENASGTSSSSCESGLKAIPGCSGDCTCGGILASSGFPTTLQSIDTCTKSPIETISEPTVSASGAAVNPNDPLRGFADLHVHMFAHLAHGGTVVSGTPYDPSCIPNGSCPTESTAAPGGVNTALHEDFGTSLHIVDQNKNNADQTIDISKCNAYLNGLGSDQDSTINSFVCGDSYVLHGNHGGNTLTGGGTNDGAASNFGAPVFNGWPQSNSTIHQQVYYKWLQRAWMGGLRLMTMFAVSNEALCKTNYVIQGTDCTDSMAPVDAQLQAAWNFQIWLDTQYGGAGKGWFRIVTNPQQAADVIKHGNLAVVLGIEVDNLFNCHRGADSGSPYEATVGLPAQYNNTCTVGYIQERVQHYYDLGVRQVFPIHNFDNAFGSPAAWQDPINAGNRASEGAWYQTENCSSNSNNASGYGFWLDPQIDTVELLLGFGITDNPHYDCGYRASGVPDVNSFFCNLPIIQGYASCNANGLTSLGTALIQELMNHQMIVDVDHLSARSLDQALSQAESHNYAGIVASHVQFFDLYETQYYPPDTKNYGRHERMRTTPQLNRIKNLGGLIAVMLKDDAQDTQNGFCASTYSLNTMCAAPVVGSGPLKEGGRFTNGNYGTTNDNCRYSTSEWYQAYRKGVDTMGGPVAMGSDFNGIAGHVGPRFGSTACGGNGAERSAQEKATTLSTTDSAYRGRLQYPFTVPGFGQFGLQVSGERTFNFNTDGLAHIGLLPDMVADLYNIDPDADLEPLFHSAKAYVDMWSKIAPPVASQLLVSAPATAIAGTSFDITVTAADSYGNTATTYSGTVHFTSSDGAAILPANATLTNGIGTFAVTLNSTASQTITATDIANSSITGSATVIVNKPPTITSANNTTFTTGVAGSFTVTATGYPTSITFSAAGALPSGVTFSSAGVLSGTPAAGSGGSYPITITASNGVLPNATQNFTLTVNQPPAITSANNTTFTTGIAGSFTVTATGYPTSITFSAAGALPSGVTFSSAGVLSGTPAAGSGGSYPITITASNGVLPNATQNFTLTIDQPPAITSTSTTSFIVATPGSFSLTATGYPAPTFSETGALPVGVSLSSAGVLSGTPAAGTAGTYPITITASNGVLPNASQPFTLRVGDFTMAVGPLTQTIPAGHVATYNVSLTSLGGLAASINMSCSGGPPNSTCSITSPITLNGTSTSTIKLNTPMNVNLGTFTLTFTGKLGPLTHTVQVTLTVK